MNGKFNFEKLDVYQKYLYFSEKVYIETSKWQMRYRYNLVDQIMRASLSIPLNITEGSSRTKKDFKRYLSIARGSCFECIPIIEILHKLGLLSTKRRNEWYNLVVEPAKMISGLRNSI